ncbi:MAG: hypothetical protein M1499_02285 [Firmicutes bacterium]|nr:hypothetical protein [Bacillota bacterium]
MMEVHYENSKPAFPTKGIVLVGVCASGKTTASQGLAKCGITARAVAQEHSMISNLYQRSGTGLVVVLVANWSTVHRRRRLAWERNFYRTEWNRLTRSRQDAKLILHTDSLTREEVVAAIVRWWDREMGLDRLWASHPEWSSVTRSEMRHQATYAKTVPSLHSSAALSH